MDRFSLALGAAAGIVIGFALGFGVPAWMSRRRRHNRVGSEVQPRAKRDFARGVLPITCKAQRGRRQNSEIARMKDFGAPSSVQWPPGAILSWKTPPADKNACRVHGEYPK